MSSQQQQQQEQQQQQQPPGGGAQMPGKPSRIPEHAFQVAIGVLLAIAVITAVGRTVARLSKFRQILADDVFFYFATILLVAGTGLLYADIPFIYLQINVEAGLQKPPTDLIEQLVHSEKLQDASTVLLSAAIFSIKFSFLFFFRHLIWQSKRLMYYWWFVLVICIPSAALVMFSDFIACRYFDESIVVKCVTPSALSRQNGILKASVALDIITDAMIISIPILLLWKVQISLRRKLALGGILCLSIFMIVIAIVRISLGDIANGQVDAAWVIFWLQIEASVAVLVNSVSAFRALFVAAKSSKYDEKSGGLLGPLSSGRLASKARLLWPSKWSRHSQKSESSPDVSRRDPTFPGTSHSGFKTHIRHDSLSDRALDPSQLESGHGPGLPLQVHVRQDISLNDAISSSSMEGERRKPSLEAFV